MAKIEAMHPHAKRVSIKATESDDGRTVYVTATVDGKEVGVDG